MLFTERVVDPVSNTSSSSLSESLETSSQSGPAFGYKNVSPVFLEVKTNAENADLGE